MASSLNADNGVVSGSAGLKSSADSSGVLALQTNGTTAVTVTTAQNVGVGTTTPLDLLHINKATAADAYVRTSNSLATTVLGSAADGNTYVFNNAAYSIKFFTNSTERFSFGSSGQLGVGGAYGTAGQVLTSGGSGAAPSWTTPSSGALVKLSAQTFTAQASDIVFTSGISSTYKVYKLDVQMYASNGSSWTPSLQVYANGATDSNAAYASKYVNSSGTLTVGGSTSSMAMFNLASGGTIATQWSFEVTIYANFSQSTPFAAQFSTSGSTNAGVYLINAIGGYTGSSGRNSAITGVVVANGAQPVTGVATLYGVVP